MQVVLGHTNGPHTAILSVRMIYRLEGTLLEKLPDAIVLDVQGVGYLIYTNPLVIPAREGATLTVHTYLAVRETALDLYGFVDQEERAVFLHLLNLPKIGPKSALQILQKAQIATLKQCVAKQDSAALAKQSGLGTKTAEKIVQGLKDVFTTEHYNHLAIPLADEQRDIQDALIALGYSERDAEQAVQTLVKEDPDVFSDSSAAVSRALRALSRP